MAQGMDEVGHVDEHPAQRQRPPGPVENPVGIAWSAGESVVEDVGPSEQADVDIGQHQQDAQLTDQVVEFRARRNGAVDRVVSDAESEITDHRVADRAKPQRRASRPTQDVDAEERAGEQHPHHRGRPGKRRRLRQPSETLARCRVQVVD